MRLGKSQIHLDSTIFALKSQKENLLITENEKNEKDRGTLFSNLVSRRILPSSQDESIFTQGGSSTVKYVWQNLYHSSKISFLEMFSQDNLDGQQH